MSAATELGTKAKTGVEGLGLTGATVVVRKVPALLDGDELPLIVLVVAEEAESEPLDALNRLEKYPVGVVIYRKDGRKTADDQTVRTWREQLKQLFDDRDRETFAGMSAGYSINRCTATNGKPPYDPAALKVDLVASEQLFTVEVIETRVRA